MSNINKISCSIFLIVFLIFPEIVQAEYVLPYPSYMPGSKLYKISRIVDYLKRYWYWGEIGSMKYHMQLSDKYLVEAKTLFEYKQYLLAIDALRRSDYHFKEIYGITKWNRTAYSKRMALYPSIKDEISAHTLVLSDLMLRMPKDFLWEPEKQSPHMLNIEKDLERSIQARGDLKL